MAPWRINQTTYMDSPHAWLVATAASAANFVAFGTLLSFGVFLTPIAETFGTTTGPVAPLFSGAICFYYLAGAVGGRLSDRHGARPIILIGALSMTLGLAAGSQVNGLWQMYLLYMPLIGIGVGCCYSPAIGAVGRWFERRRSLAVSIVLAGVGAGTLVIPSLSRALIQAHSWRTTLAVLAILAFVVVGSAGAVTDRPPTQHGNAHPSKAPSVFKSRHFRRLYASVIVLGPGFYAPFAFFNDYAVAQGIDSSAAAALVGVVGASSVVSRLTFGALGDRPRALPKYRFGYLVMSAALMVWLMAGGSFILLVVSAVLHGIGWAAWVTATPMVLAEWFGIESLGGVLGTFYTGLGIGALMGPAVSGFVIDQAGYRWAVALVAISTVAASALALTPMTQLSAK
jgi:MFS family permease